MENKELPLPLVRKDSDSDSLFDVERTTERLRQVTKKLSQIALTHSDGTRLIQLADEWHEQANDLQEIAKTAIERKEEFGGEESYETVFRMFSATQNQSKAWSIEEIWERLEKNYDLSNESYETIEETLWDWAADLKEDMKEKRHIDGQLIFFEGKFVFAEEATSFNARPKKITRKPRPAASEKNEDEAVPEDESALILCSLLAQATDDSIKQSLLKKALQANEVFFNSGADAQELIDRLVGEQRIFKFKKQNVAYLSLTEHEDEKVETILPLDDEHEEAEKDLDLRMMKDILKALCAPGTHVQQKFTLNELYRRVVNSISKSQPIDKEELERLKNMCQMLKQLNLVVMNAEKRGTSGTSMSKRGMKSGRLMVLKVGIVDQETKKRLQSLLTQPHPERFLEELIAE